MRKIDRVLLFFIATALCLGACGCTLRRYAAPAQPVPATEGQAEAVSPMPAAPETDALRETPEERAARETAAPQPSETPASLAETEPPETMSPSGPAAFYSEAVWRDAAAYVAEMPDEDKIYQLFVVNPDTVTGVTGTTLAGDATRAALERYPVGGMVYQSNNIRDREQLTALLSGQQGLMDELGKTPLLTSVDEEGGTVTRLRDVIEGTLDSMYSYEAEGADTAYQNAVTTAGRLAAVGLNTDFAPVADVWSNDANTVIGSRAYSKDFQSAAELVAAAVRGFRDKGIVCTLKHFPGHGDTLQDSHQSAAVATKSRAELEAEEFLPFAAGIAAGADMVMIGHLNVEALDESGTPATFSKTIVTDILRGQLGFQGVIITDSLKMNAATEVGAAGELCVRALEAGCDLLLGAANTPAELEQCRAAILDAIASGRLTWERIDESVQRVIALKLGHDILVL